MWRKFNCFFLFFWDVSLEQICFNFCLLASCGGQSWAKSQYFEGSGWAWSYTISRQARVLIYFNAMSKPWEVRLPLHPWNEFGSTIYKKQPEIISKQNNSSLHHSNHSKPQPQQSKQSLIAMFVPAWDFCHLFDPFFSINPPCPTTSWLLSNLEKTLYLFRGLCIKKIWQELERILIHHLLMFSHLQAFKYSKDLRQAFAWGFAVPPTGGLQPVQIWLAESL